MRAILAVAAVTVGLGAFQCASQAVAPAAAPCKKVVLEDTTVVYVSADTTIMATSKKDTVPVPYTTCLTLYAAAKDTVPVP